jgi:Uma2 family endonuclease
MLTRQKEMTAEEFIVFAHLPENADQRLEFIDGEVVEFFPGSTAYSQVATILAAHVYQFCQQHNLPCHISGSKGPYGINGNVVTPSFAYKSTEMSDEYPDPNPPLWVSETIFPTEKAISVRNKREIYDRASILLWEIYYLSRSIDVYAPGQPPKSYKMGDVLDGSDVLPGFTLEVAKLFK